jgi:hypothetical protein
MQAWQYRLPGSIVPNNEGERLVELDDMCVVWAEAPDALDEHLQMQTCTLHWTA